MASTRFQIKLREEQEKSERAIDALRIAMMNKEQIPAESVLNLQGVARPFQAISAYNPEFGRRVNDQIGPKKVTRLMYAAYVGDEARLLALIKQGARRNIVSTTGKTALFYAVQKQHIGAVRILLEAPIPFGSPQEQPIFNRDALTLSPITEAIRFLYYYSENKDSEAEFRAHQITRILIIKAPEGSFQNQPYLYNLFFKCTYASYFEYANLENLFLGRILDLAQICVDKGAELYCDDREDGDLLHVMVTKNFINFANFLIYELQRRGKSINYLYNGRSLLSCLYENYDDEESFNLALEMCRFLISKGADVNLLINGHFVLTLLIRRFGNHDPPRTLAIVREILDSSAASINVIRGGEGVLIEAMDHRRLDIIQLLLERGADPALAILERTREF
jgi:ankyrin repeat protein